MSTVQSIQRQQAELSEKIESLEIRLEHERRQAARDTRAKMAALSAEMDKRIAAHDRNTEDVYRRALEETVSREQDRISMEIGRLRQQYDELEGQLDRELAAEQQKTEQMLIDAKRFEEAYNSRRDYARTRAVQQRDAFVERFSQVTEKVPLEFFFPGHIDLYRRRIQDTADLLSAGLYESVIGICADLMMQLSFDVIETDQRSARWMHYHTVLRQLLHDEEQRAVSLHRLPEGMDMLGRYMHAVDGRISDEQLDLWSDGRYSEIHRSYDEMVLSGAGDLPDDDDAITEYMIMHPERSRELTEMYLYDRIQSALSRRTEQIRVADLMYSRMAAWEERVRLYTELRSVLSDEGYTCKLSDESGDHVVTFTDDMSVHEFELVMIPVRRRSDDRYVNTAVCFYPPHIDIGRRDEIIAAAAEVLVTKGIDVEHRPMEAGQTTQMRVRAAAADKVMQINGRMD